MNSPIQSATQNPDHTLRPVDDIVTELETSHSHAKQFEPYQSLITCPECKHEITLLFQPVHLDLEIFCPNCLNDLTTLIRDHISLHAYD